MSGYRPSAIDYLRIDQSPQDSASPRPVCETSAVPTDPYPWMGLSLGAARQTVRISRFAHSSQKNPRHVIGRSAAHLGRRVCRCRTFSLFASGMTMHPRLCW